MKLLTMIAAGTIASVAQADAFFIVTEGVFDITDVNGDVYTGELATTVGTQVGPFDFGSVTGGFEATLTDPGPISGSFSLISSGGDGTVEIGYEGTVVGDDVTFSYAANWSVTDATGIYDGLTGDGDLSGSHFFTGIDDGIVSLTIQGDLVPAPATLALLGVGGLVASRRRR